MRVEIKSNIKSVRRKIDRAFKKFPKEMDSAVGNAGNKVAGEVKEKTPVQTGSLLGSIRANRKGLGQWDIEADDRFGRGTRPSGYVDKIERGRGNRLPTDQKNRRASKGRNGGYQMFGRNVRRAEKWLRVLVIKRLKAITRKI